MKKIQSSLFLSALLSSTSLFASGLSKPVLIGPKAIGLGGAFTGISDDATAVFHNPAAMSQLDGTQFFIGGEALITKLDYTPQIAGTTVGPKESAKREFLPVPNGAVTMRLFDRATVGLGVFFPHGNGGKFNTASLIPTNPLEGRIYSMEVTPAVSLTLIDGLSIGGSFRATRISSEIKGQLVAIGSAVDTINSLDVSGWGYGYSASAFYNRFKPISIGFNYRSKISTDLDGNASLAALGNGDVSLKQTLPEQYNAGLGLHITEAVTVGVGYQFEKNSQIKNFVATSAIIPGGSVTLPQNWSDSHTWMIGAEAKLCKSFAIRGGYARDFDSSIPAAAQNRVTGDIAAHETSAGLSYQWKNLNIASTWNARFGDRNVVGAPPSPTSAGQVGPGNYDAIVHSVSLGLGYKL